MLIRSSQEMGGRQLPSCKQHFCAILPQGITYWDPYLGSVVHRTSDGLIKAKTIAGPPRLPCVLLLKDSRRSPL